MSKERTIFAKLHQDLQPLILAMDDNSRANRVICSKIKDLGSASTLLEFTEKLNVLGFDASIKLLANYQPFQDVVLAFPQTFIDKYPRDAIKALIYQACLLGNTTFVTYFVDAIKLNILEEFIAGPNGAREVTARGDHVNYHDKVPILQVAAQSGDLELFKSIIRAYDLSSLDLNAGFGLLQACLIKAIESRSAEIAIYLLELGVNPKCQIKDYWFSALQNAITWGNFNVIASCGVKICDFGYTEKELIIRSSHVDLAKYFINNGLDFNDDAFEYIKLAFSSGSIDMLQLLIKHFKFNDLPNDLYPFEDASKKEKDIFDSKFIFLILASLRCTPKTIEFMEQTLKIPVSQILKDELESDIQYNKLHDNPPLIRNLISTYNVPLIKHVFETLNIKPTKKQLNQLISIAYDSVFSERNGVALTPEKIFATFTYIYSLVHSDLLISELLSQASDTPDLSNFSDGLLFTLFAEMATSNPMTSIINRRGDLLCNNSLFIMDKIAQRKLSSQQLIELAQSDNGKYAGDILFYLIVNDGAYPLEQVKSIITAPCFNLNDNSYPAGESLRIAFKYRNNELIPFLHEHGAVPRPSVPSVKSESPQPLLNAFNQLKLENKGLAPGSDVVADEQKQTSLVKSQI